MLCHQFFLARSSAICAARRASTPATLMRYSLVPRLSSIGWQAALRGGVELLQRGVVDLAADQRLGGVGHQQRPRGHRAERHARRRADAAWRRASG